MLDAVLTPLLSILIVLTLILLFSLLEWIVGRVLWNFESTRKLGFSMMAYSGFFVKDLPDFCPKEKCVSCCKIWSCPNYRKKSADVEH